MRLLLILILATGVLFAKTKDTCYSVQLTSFVKKQDYNFEQQNYPDSCRIFKFSNMNAVRCGCFKRYGDAKKQKRVFSAAYSSASIVKTYSYRFAPKKSIAKQEQSIKVVAPIIPKEDIVVQEETPSVDDTYAFMEDIVIQGNVNMQFQKYITRPTGKHANNYTASAELEAAYNKGDFKAFAQFRAQQDYYDLEGTSQHNDRSYLRINELYAQYDFEDSQILFGKNVRFWGALEVHNLTDGFNIRDFRSDPTKNDKVGSWNGSYTMFTETGELSVIVKFNEENRKMPAFPYVYYPFANQQITYDSDVKTEKSKNRPSVYVKYAGSTDTEYTLDYAIIFENGYDSQRYYNKTASQTNRVYENAYIVNKLMTYNTLVVGSTLFKLEAVYANVVDDKNIADYYNLGLGMEHTLAQVYQEADLGLLVEYYKYDTINANANNYNDLDLFETFQNDIFVGFRYSFNEGNDASIVGGGIFDLDYNEQVYYIEYESRINDMFKLNLDYRQTEPSSSKETALNRMGKQKRVSIKVGYYF